MDQTNTPLQNQAQKINTSPAVDTDISIDDVFGDAIGVVRLSEDPDSLYRYFVASPMYAGFGDLNAPARVFFLQDYNNSSPTLKNYFTSAETIDTIFAVGKNSNLEDNQISILSTLIRDLLTGKIFIKDFPITISSKLGIDDIKAGEIANQIISKSFGPIIEDVKRIQRSKFPDKISQMQKSSQPAGLTQPMARQDSFNKTLGGSPQVANPLPGPEVGPPKQPPAQPQNMRPSPQPQQSQQVRPPTQVPSQSPPNLPNQNIRPPVSVETEPQSKPQLQPLPATKQTPKPQFKVPDLSGMMPPPQTPSGKAGESLEKELEQVANIIDLRNKPPEK